MTERCMTAAALLVVLAVSGCGASHEDEARLTVFAAASTTDVVQEIARSFVGARVATSFGSSGSLARQICDGAPADVFISANARWVEYLEEADQLAGPPRAFCRNRLVCVARPGAFARDSRPSKASELAGRLAAGDCVAIADAGVPAGDYARESLAATGDLDHLAGRLVGQTDVRAVSRAVESGQAVFGFVYATDARVAAVDVLFELDPATHVSIDYFAAVTRRGGAAASAFVQHLESPATSRILGEAGFEIVPR